MKKMKFIQNNLLKNRFNNKGKKIKIRKINLIF